jgi:hypothetical protein
MIPQFICSFCVYNLGILNRPLNAKKGWRLCSSGRTPTKKYEVLSSHPSITKKKKKEKNCQGKY